MENNKDFPVQNRLNQYIKEDKYGFTEIDYSGGIKLLTKEDFNKLVNKISQLKNKNNKDSEKITSLVEENKSLVAENKSLQNQIVKFRSEIEIMKQKQEKYEQFIKRQGKGRPKVLTPEVKEIIKQGHSSKVQIKTIHQELTKRGISISYETVREYIASSSKAKRWL